MQELFSIKEDFYSRMWVRQTVVALRHIYGDRTGHMCWETAEVLTEVANTAVGDGLLTVNEGKTLIQLYTYSEF